MSASEQSQREKAGLGVEPLGESRVEGRHRRGRSHLDDPLDEEAGARHVVDLHAEGSAAEDDRPVVAPDVVAHLVGEVGPADPEPVRGRMNRPGDVCASGVELAEVVAGSAPRVEDVKAADVTDQAQDGGSVVVRVVGETAEWVAKASAKLS